MKPPQVVVMQQQMCSSGKDFGEYLIDFQFIQAPVCAYANNTGILLMGMLVYGAILSSIYIRTNSLIIPSVLLLLTGGAVLSQVAAVGTPVAVLIVLVVPAGLFALAYYLYS